MSKVDEGEIIEEEEESGDDEDMGKYMIESDPEEKEKEPEPPREETEEEKRQSLKDFMSETVPANKRGMGGHRVPVHGNERTMNLNHLILANITESAYFRSDLVQLKSYEDMMDEIYYRVQHLEPWEKGSRKAFTGSTTGAERGMAYSSIPGVSNYVGVRGVGQGK